MSSAQERLAAAIWGVDFVDPEATLIARAMVAADPHLAQDIEDGAALRRLREALGPAETFDVSVTRRDPWIVEAWDLPSLRHLCKTSGATVAEAADKVREALEKRP